MQGPFVRTDKTMGQSAREKRAKTRNDPKTIVVLVFKLSRVFKTGQTELESGASCYQCQYNIMINGFFFWIPKSTFPDVLNGRNLSLTTTDRAVCKINEIEVNLCCV